MSGQILVLYRLTIDLPECAQGRLEHILWRLGLGYTVFLVRLGNEELLDGVVLGFWLAHGLLGL